MSMKKFILSILTAIALVSAPAFADQTRTFTITKPASYADGTAFGTETLAYIVYDAATNAQLFSTRTLVTTKTIPDTAKCYYARAAVYNETTQNVYVGPDGKQAISVPSENSCNPAPIPATKIPGAPGLVVK
jgi:hypothetical protein